MSSVEFLEEEKKEESSQNEQESDNRVHAIKKLILPKEEWVYCRDEHNGIEYLGFEYTLYARKGKEILWKLKFDEPILSVSVDSEIVVATGNKIVCLNRELKTLWTKKLRKTVSSVCHRGDRVLVAHGKKITFLDLNGDSIWTKKFKGEVFSVFISDVIIVGTEKGIHALSHDGKVVWEVHLGKIISVAAGDVIAAAKENEVIALSFEGEILWREKIDDLVVDMYVTASNISVVTFFNQSKITYTLDGKMSTVVKLERDYKYLPKPQIVVSKKLAMLKNILKEAKKLKPKQAVKLMKEANKKIKKKNYGEALELINAAFDVITELQFSVKIPKKVKIGKEFEIVVKPHNFSDVELENTTYDLTDLEKYFELSEKIIAFPPIRRGMSIEKYVKAVPKYEGKFVFTIQITSNVGSFSKEFQIEVKKRLFSLPILIRREKKKSIVDLIR